MYCSHTANKKCLRWGVACVQDGCLAAQRKKSVNAPPAPKEIKPWLSRLSEFDEAIQKVTQQRGSVYGHPKTDFGRASRMKAVVAECKDPLMRHVLEMICVKVARLIETPGHLDSLIDIAGYARTGVMVTDPDSASVAETVEG